MKEDVISKSREIPRDFQKKIDSLKQKVNTSDATLGKTGENLIQLYDGSVTNFSKIFALSSQSLASLYEKMEIMLVIDNNNMAYRQASQRATFKSQSKGVFQILRLAPKLTPTQQLNSYVNALIKDGYMFISQNLMRSSAIFLTQIKVVTNFQTFKKEEFGGFNYQSDVEFIFDNTKYTVRDSPNTVSIEKPYGSQLTEKEIDAIVNAQIKQHEAFIEQKLDVLNR